MQENRPFRFGISPTLGSLRAQQISRQLGGLLKDALGTAVEVRVAGSWEHLEAMLLGGRIDAAWANPLVISQVQAAGVAEVLRGVRHGCMSFRAALVARKEDSLRLDALEGTRIAWTDPDSLGGYRLPHRFLTEQGIVPAETFRDERFTFSYPAALVRLLEGWVDLAPCFVHRADPAALDEVLQLLLGADADRLAPLAFTEAVPNDGIVLGPQADPIWLRRLEEVTTSPRGGELYDLLDVEALIAASTEDYAEEGLLGPYRSRRTSRGPL